MTLDHYDTDNPSMYLASLETRNFSFQAAGTSESEARAGIAAAVKAHATTYALRNDWASDCDISVVEMVLGEGYRDHERITAPSAS